MSECTLIATITTQPLFRSLFSMVSLAYLSVCVRPSSFMEVNF